MMVGEGAFWMGIGVNEELMSFTFLVKCKVIRSELLDAEELIFYR